MPTEHPEIPRFTNTSFGVPLNFDPNARFCTYRPNWFARVVLRRKPKYATMPEAMRQARRQFNDALDRAFWKESA